jgi:hypothetical protein
MILWIRRLSVLGGKEYVSKCVFDLERLLKLSPKRICSLGVVS